MIKPLRELAAKLPDKKLHTILWDSRNGHRYYKVRDEENNTLLAMKGSVFNALGERGYMFSSKDINVVLLKSDLAYWNERKEKRVNRKPTAKKQSNQPF